MTAPARGRLAAELRALRQRTGLSLAGLAHRTPYSKSSWSRYLNGSVPVPRQAVEELCRLAGERSRRPVALWELADAEWSGRTGEASSGEASARTDRERTEPVAAGRREKASAKSGRATQRVTALGVSAAVVLAVGVALVMIRVQGGEVSPGHAATVSLPPPGCRGRACAGGDPQSMACGLDARTLSGRRTPAGAGLEIRFSARCGAAWARIWQTRVGDRVEITPSGGRSQRASVADRFDAEGYLFTRMVPAPNPSALRACLVPASGRARVCVAP
ncbi:XRE family transcriptional regulator [Streptomyces luteolifulvus]|uniref:XRE family transcriptional regulator n=1 Tax=Streptomyces luteolifulvus TaxID=2615112 RepID=A0A6H9UR88_9ACTN|nr:XRE family transcriptional regulator [Streptomyces luteolifulvus]KAB1140668.1 XRE family transcriptional regulator [Streptomyces luteolifulvus]